MYSAQISKKEYIDSLFEEYSDMIYRLALIRTKNKEDAEDVFQEVFLRLSKKMPEFQNKQHEKAWLIRVTINVSKNLFLSAWKRKVTTLEEDIQFEEEKEKEVYLEVMRLPQRYRSMIHLFYYEGFSIKEISNLLKINENTVKTRLARAREKLRARLEGGFDE